jgi:ribosomal protein S3
LNINIQYYLSQKTLFYITPKFKRQNNNLKLKNTYIKKYSNYKLLNYQVDLNNILQKKKLESVKSLLKPKNKISKVKRINSSKFLYQKSKIKIIKLNSFLEKFFKSLQFFLKKNYNIFLTLKQLKKQNSASLLAEFIATEMQKLKKHNFFLRFVKSTLAIFRSKNIKIKIKGRFNGAPRAKHKIIKIKNGVPALTLNSNIDYAEKTSYTQNGTFGVKVWIHD